MKTTFVLAGVLATALALAPGSALAWSSHGGHRTSVFPRPADPWRHWGHQHHGFKHHHGFHPQRGVHQRGSAVIVPRGHRVVAPVWVPGRWVWNGFTWLWAPGHWVR